MGHSDRNTFKEFISFYELLVTGGRICGNFPKIFNWWK